MVEEIRDITVGGQQLRIAHRAGEGRPLLVCNGIGASLELLTPFVEALDPQIPVIRFDVPGAGHSPLPTGPYRFFTLANLVRKLVERLGYSEFDVLGISWGGMFAQQIAYQFPTRCRRLVAVSTGTGFTMVPGRPRVLRIMSSPRRHRDPQYAVKVAPVIYGGRFRDDPKSAFELLGDNSPPPTRGYRYQLGAITGWTSLPFLRLIRQPTLVVAGSDDPIVPLANARVLTALIPNSRMHVFDDGHMGLVTSAPDVAPVIASFLRDGSLDTAGDFRHVRET